MTLNWFPLDSNELDHKTMLKKSVYNYDGGNIGIVSQMFGNILVMWDTIQQFWILFLRSGKWLTTPHCQMPSSPNTLHICHLAYPTLAYWHSSLAYPTLANWHGSLAYPTLSNWHGSLAYLTLANWHDSLAYPILANCHGSLAYPTLASWHGTLAYPTLANCQNSLASLTLPNCQGSCNSRKISWNIWLTAVWSFT